MKYTLHQSLFHAGRLQCTFSKEIETDIPLHEGTFVDGKTWKEKQKVAQVTFHMDKGEHTALLAPTQLDAAEGDLVKERRAAFVDAGWTQQK